jgi:SAM-dependent methyltransferase
MNISEQRELTRRDIADRYDVTDIREDAWHSYADAERSRLIKTNLADNRITPRLMLNAGAGVHSLKLPGWQEIRLDLFRGPLRGDPHSVCGTILNLPFSDFTFGAVVCVGEVLGYCDPAQAVPELSRVLAIGGLLILDFASTRSPRFWLSSTYGRAADIITVDYNGCPERVWAYDPSYVKTLVRKAGLSIIFDRRIMGWAAAIKRIGLRVGAALYVDAKFNRLIGTVALGDLSVICARRSESEILRQ